MRSLLGVSALVLLSGCGWFGGGNKLDSQKVRPGCRSQLSPSAARCRRPIPVVSTTLDIVATDETRTPRIGSIVAAKGGQKAQKEAAEKETAERDAKEREAREKREAADREEKAREKEKEPPTDDCPLVGPGTSWTTGSVRARQCRFEQDHARGGTRHAAGADRARYATCGDAAGDDGTAAGACHNCSRAAAACEHAARAGTAGAVTHVVAAAARCARDRLGITVALGATGRRYAGRRHGRLARGPYAGERRARERHADASGGCATACSSLERGA